jgi:predicted Fe-Mo cluster-binding NifX family protein
MSDEPELFLRAKIADKAVGHSAAELMVLGGVSEVYADYMSEQAYDILTEAGIKVSYGKKVDHERFLEIWVMLGEIDK